LLNKKSASALYSPDKHKTSWPKVGSLKTSFYFLVPEREAGFAMKPASSLFKLIPMEKGDECGGKYHSPYK
jgi:hypothetical protein